MMLLFFPSSLRPLVSLPVILSKVEQNKTVKKQFEEKRKNEAAWRKFDKSSLRSEHVNDKSEVVQRKIVLSTSGQTNKARITEYNIK